MNKNPKTFISTQLRRIIANEKITINQLAERLGMPYQTLLNYSNGSREPKWDFLKLLHEQLGVNLDWFVSGNGPLYREQRDNGDKNPQNAENQRYNERAGNICSWVENYMNNSDPDEQTWLDVEMSRHFPEYKQFKQSKWRNPNEPTNGRGND